MSRVVHLFLGCAATVCRAVQGLVAEVIASINPADFPVPVAYENFTRFTGAYLAKRGATSKPAGGVCPFSGKSAGGAAGDVCKPCGPCPPCTPLSAALHGAIGGALAAALVFFLLNRRR